MADNARVLVLCGSLEAYERFKVEWALVCYRLNPSRANKRRLERAIFEKRTEG